MGSALDDAPLVQNIDAVGVLDGRKAVKEICNLKDFLLTLNENQSTALRLQIKLTWI